MSFGIAALKAIGTAPAQVTTIGSTIAATDAAASSSTTWHIAPGTDEVSTAIATLFGVQGQAYQAVSTQLQALQAEFVQALSGASVSQASAESAGVEQQLADSINAPIQSLLGRPSIGDGGTDGAGRPARPACIPL